MVQIGPETTVTNQAPLNCQNFQKTCKKALKKSKIARKHIILQKQRKACLVFYPSTNILYTTVGCAVIPFSRSLDQWPFSTDRPGGLPISPPIQLKHSHFQTHTFPLCRHTFRIPLSTLHVYPCGSCDE